MRLGNKTILITGATNGIGLAAAEALAALGENIAIVGRNETRTKIAAARIRAAAGKGATVGTFVADLSSQAAVRKLATEVLARYPRLDVLINNAGAMYTTREATNDGIELTWAVNHPAPFLLTTLLLDRLKESSIWIDCDVLQADGGTRTAAITGGYIALALAVRALKERGDLEHADVLADSVAAVSAGIVDGAPMLDLCYEEDSRAEVDFNVVMTGSGRLVEVQGTAEGQPFSREQLDEMIALAAQGIERLTAVQREAAGA